MDIHFVVCSEIPYRNITRTCLNKMIFGPSWSCLYDNSISIYLYNQCLKISRCTNFCDTVCQRLSVTLFYPYTSTPLLFMYITRWHEITKSAVLSPNTKNLSILYLFVFVLFIAKGYNIHIWFIVMQFIENFNFKKEKVGKYSDISMIRTMF